MMPDNTYKDYEPRRGELLLNFSQYTATATAIMTIARATAVPVPDCCWDCCAAVVAKAEVVVFWIMVEVEEFCSIRATTGSEGIVNMTLHDAESNMNGVMALHVPFLSMNGFACAGRLHG